MTRTACCAALLLVASASVSDAQEPIAPPTGRPVPDLQVAPPPLPKGDPDKKPAAKKEKKPLPRAAVLEEVAGVLRAVSPRDGKLTLQTPAGGDVTLGYDR